MQEPCGEAVAPRTGLEPWRCGGISPSLHHGRHRDEFLFRPWLRSTGPCACGRTTGLMWVCFLAWHWLQECSFKCSAMNAEENDAGMTRHKFLAYGGLSTGPYWT